jgi:hypothetical protein
MEAVANINTEAQSEGDAVLIAFAEAHEAGTASLSEWMRRYPAHARELARYAAHTWAGDTVYTEAAPSAEALRVRRIGLEVARACRAAQTAPQTAPQTALTSLLAVVKAQGLKPEVFAQNLGISYALFFKLHRRLIAPDSVPARFVQSLAEALERSVDEVRAYLNQGPTLAAGASYRSDNRPQAGQQETFAQAVASDPEMTDEQRNRWIQE